MEREIELFIDHATLRYDSEQITKTVIEAINEIGVSFPKGDLSLAILSDEKVTEIHGDFLDDPSETDVITFPGDVEMNFAGEICVSADRAKKCHTEHETSFSEELTLYVVHGLLHLSGLNDKTPEQSAEMRKGEAKTMNALRAKGSIPLFEI